MSLLGTVYEADDADRTRRRRITSAAIPPIIASPTMPPTTPPAIAPAFDDLCVLEELMDVAALPVVVPVALDAIDEDSAASAWS